MTELTSAGEIKLKQKTCYSVGAEEGTLPSVRQPGSKGWVVHGNHNTQHNLIFSGSVMGIATGAAQCGRHLTVRPFRYAGISILQLFISKTVCPINTIDWRQNDAQCPFLPSFLYRILNWCG